MSIHLPDFFSVASKRKVGREAKKTLPVLDLGVSLELWLLFKVARTIDAKTARHWQGKQTAAKPRNLGLGLG
jgi:hypothetical protein